MSEVPQQHVALVRSEFIHVMYPRLFGDEEMGDGAEVFTPSDLTAVLVAYEGLLGSRGLLRATQLPQTDKE